MCCTSGRGVVEVQGRTFPLRDNEALCIPRLCPHRYWADEEDPWSLLWVHFQGEDCGYYPLDRRRSAGFRRPGRSAGWNSSSTSCSARWNQDYTLGNFIYLSQLLALILGETYARRQEDGTTARQNRQVTRGRAVYVPPPGPGTHAGGTLRRDGHLPEHPQRGVPAVHRHAPMDFFTRLKMKQACRMLRSGGEYVYEVAGSSATGTPTISRGPSRR